MPSPTLFDPYRLGRIELPNRAVMAPLTRCRCPGNVPGPLVAEYYAQRAGLGLLITEGTSPSPNGLGYPRIPGMFSDDQVAGWRGVADAVHAAGGKMFVQLMHTGRVSHRTHLPAGARILAPSAVRPPGQLILGWPTPLDYEDPAPMTQDDIDATVDEYARAAVLAVEQAGLDGIELHGANGYLIEQFLNLGANQRTDRWGGTVDGRIRFAVEVARRCVAAIGADRVGIRLSPYGETNGSIPDADTDELYLTLADELSRLGLVYLHLVDHSTWGRPSAPPELVTRIRDTFGGALILSGGYDLARANADLAAHRGDLIAFGRPALANPDLLPRLRHGTPLNHPDTATFYTDGPTGYTDYPTAE